MTIDESKQQEKDQMKGTNFLLMNKATLMLAIQYWINSEMVKDNQPICVTNFTAQMSNPYQGLYEVTIEPQSEIKAEG